MSAVSVNPMSLVVPSSSREREASEYPADATLQHPPHHDTANTNQHCSSFMATTDNIGESGEANTQGPCYLHVQCVANAKRQCLKIG